MIHMINSFEFHETNVSFSLTLFHTGQTFFDEHEGGQFGPSIGTFEFVN